MELVQIENWEINIWKVNDFNFLNEEVEQFSNQWSSYLVNVRAMLGDPEILIFTALKAIDSLIIYLFFASNLMLPEEFLYKFELLKWLQFVIF